MMDDQWLDPYGADHGSAAADAFWRRKLEGRTPSLALCQAIVPDADFIMHAGMFAANGDENTAQTWRDRANYPAPRAGPEFV